MRWFQISPYVTATLYCNPADPTDVTCGAPVDSVIHAARTDRIRKLVLESGPQRLSRWIDYQRDIAADYRRLYGEEPGALIGVAVMTDADNTQGRSEAYYGPISLTTADGRRLD